MNARPGVRAGLSAAQADALRRVGGRHCPVCHRIYIPTGEGRMPDHRAGGYRCEGSGAVPRPLTAL